MTIKEAWKDFCTENVLADTEEAQVRKLRLAFYAGVVTMCAVIDYGSPGTIAAINKEVRAVDLDSEPL